MQLVLSENKVDGKQKLSDDAIYANSITFLLAGHETTSFTLTYTTYLLALHPDIQQRLYEDLKASIPDSQVLQQLNLSHSIVRDLVEVFKVFFSSVKVSAVALFPTIKHFSSK